MMLLHMREDQFFYRPATGEPRTVERHVSFITYHNLEYALTRIQEWEQAHSDLDNGVYVQHTLLSVTQVPMMVTEMEKMAALMRASVIENLPRKPEDFG